MTSPATLTAAPAADLAAVLRDGGLPDDPAALFDLIGELENLKSLACAVQADASVAYDAARRTLEAEQGVSARRQGRGVGTRELVARAKKAAYEIDPAYVVRRASNAESDRLVTVRPAPDGDARSRGQLMADLLVARVTGAELVPDAPTPVPVLVNLTMSDATLIGGHAPAQVGADRVGSDVLPAEISRLLVARALTAEIGAWIRQLYVDHTGQLIGMTSKQRCFADGLADFIGQRDLGICRTPFCDAPIRHRDHVVAVSAGGSTDADNGQGLCEACNHAKQAPDWRQRAVDGIRHSVETITPSGHRYRSTAPPPVGWREPRWIRERPGVYTLVA